MAQDLVEVELSRGVIAPRVARTLLTERFAQAIGSSELDTVRLLVTELVTNAVVHGQGRITLRARLDDDRIFVEVSDEGAGLERPIRERDGNDRHTGGQGLYVVDCESSRWGVDKDASRVWFELDRRGSKIEQPGSASAK